MKLFKLQLSIALTYAATTTLVLAYSLAYGISLFLISTPFLFVSLKDMLLVKN